MVEHTLTDGLLVVPDAPAAAVLVVGGSSGREEVARARLLASYGVAARTLRWYEGIPAPLSRLPLESFAPAVAQLSSVAPRVGLVGTSFGAEAVLLITSYAVASVDVVAALAPTSVAWESPIHTAAGRPVGEPKWSLAGEPVAGVPYLDWTTRLEPDTALARHEAALAACPPIRLTAAAIPVERIAASVLVSSGGRDLVWPAARFCAEIVARRTTAGLTTTHVRHPDAGHQATWPGEPARPSTLPAGGSGSAAAEHGAAVLMAVLDLLGVARRDTAYGQAHRI